MQRFPCDSYSLLYIIFGTEYFRFGQCLPDTLMACHASQIVYYLIQVIKAMIHQYAALCAVMWRDTVETV